VPSVNPLIIGLKACTVVRECKSWPTICHAVDALACQFPGNSPYIAAGFTVPSLLPWPPEPESWRTIIRHQHQHHHHHHHLQGYNRAKEQGRRTSIVHGSKSNPAPHAIHHGEVPPLPQVGLSTAHPCITWVPFCSKSSCDSSDCFTSFLHWLSIPLLAKEFIAPMDHLGWALGSRDENSLQALLVPASRASARKVLDELPAPKFA
jgi:hypothetical protein